MNKEVKNKSTPALAGFHSGRVGIQSVGFHGGRKTGEQGENQQQTQST